ncbi:hypothetical protein EON67_02195 [archaeon]|nr:MAG: hypothetical protein EON67_02195 [archaeon]
MCCGTCAWMHTLARFLANLLHKCVTASPRAPLVQKFTKAHSETGVSALQFSRDASQLLSGGYDGVVRCVAPTSAASTHGVRTCSYPARHAVHPRCAPSCAGSMAFAPASSSKSSTATRALSRASRTWGTAACLPAAQRYAPRLHPPCAHAKRCVPTRAASRALVQDGSIRIWDVKAQECTNTFAPPQAVSTSDLPILSLCTIPRTADHMLVVPGGGVAYVMNIRGVVLKSLHLASATPAPASASTACICGTVSGQGKYAYIAADDRRVYCFALASAKVEAVFSGTDAGDVLGVQHHTHRNVLAVFNKAGELRLMKA